MPVVNAAQAGPMVERTEKKFKIILRFGGYSGRAGAIKRLMSADRFTMLEGEDLTSESSIEKAKPNELVRGKTPKSDETDSMFHHRWTRYRRAVLNRKPTEIYEDHTGRIQKGIAGYTGFRPRSFPIEIPSINSTITYNTLIQPK